MLALKDRLSAIVDRVRGLNKSVAVILGIVVALCMAAALLWFLDKLLLYYFATSYVDEIAQIFDLNKGAARALSWIAFAVTVILTGYAFSWSRTRRWIGLSGLLALLVGHSLVVWFGTKDHFFERSGAAIKCYVITRDDIIYMDKAGIDPISGRQCRPVTPAVVERLQKYKGGNRPKRLDLADPVFFEPRTGEPIVWYAKTKSDAIELFDLMGFNPITGEELLPVTKEITDAWHAQKDKDARRPPERVDPKDIVFFDPVTGNARIWYRRAEGGDFEFYDRPGFHPRTGEALTVISRDAIEAWNKHLREFASQRCYIITRDAVRYGSRPGIDPATGRQCRIVTAELIERLREYERGNRPKRIVSDNPTFFDLRTGEPIVWHFRDGGGNIEMFDLMGFHPDSGEELLPVTREIVEAWKSQIEAKKREQARRPPQLIDPDKFTFFDPITGQPRVWFWRSDKGDYEFYDNAGFHPRTGEPLTVISRDAIAKWRSDLGAAEERRKQEQLEQERERKRVEEERERERRRVEEERERERQRLVEQQQRERQKIEDEQRRRAAEDQARRAEEQARKAEEQARQDAARRAGSVCDQLAANPRDPGKSPDVSGVPYEFLKAQSKEAAEACAAAVQQSPNELRFQYQQARAMEFINPDRALDMHLKLGRQRYGAAFDNAGGIYQRKKRYADAVQQFRMGAQFDDPDAIVSLADMIKAGHATGDYLALYARAAALGHPGAQLAVEREQQQRSLDEQRRINDAEGQRRAMEMFGTFLQAIPRNRP